MALPLSAADAPFAAFVDDFLFVASSFGVPLPFVVWALAVPFVVADDDDDDGDGKDVGDDDDSNAFSLLMCNLCSPFCSVSDVGTFAAALAHDFEQYGFFLSFPFPSADFPQ